MLLGIEYKEKSKVKRGVGDGVGRMAGTEGWDKGLGQGGWPGQGAALMVL